MKEVRENIVYRCWYHVVWCPKWRRKVLTSEDASVENPPIEGDPGPVDVRLREIIEEVAEESGSIVEELEVMPDHVHLLVSVDPQFGVGKFIRLCKGRSSRLLRAEFPSLKRRLPTLWTNSYFVATVGGAPLSVIAQYIENQRSV
jgi:putative transposase